MVTRRAQYLSRDYSPSPQNQNGNDSAHIVIQQ
jgi:hypothetical protein